MNVGIVLITFNRVELLTSCIDSLKAALDNERLKNRYTIHIGINGSDKTTEELIKHQRTSSIQFIAWEERKNLGEARNEVLKKMKPDWIYFVDDDVTVNPEHFVNFEKILQDYPNLKVIGGPNQHIKSQNMVQLAQEEVLSAYFVSGPFSARYRRTSKNLNASISHLILCNLFVFAGAEVLFKKNLVGAEENELLSRLGPSHRPYGFFPELSVHHERRASREAFYLQCIQIGRGRGQWESLRHPVLFRALTLWVVLLILSQTIWVSLFFSVINPRFKSPLSTRLRIVVSLYAGYMRGLMVGAFTRPLSH